MSRIHVLHENEAWLPPLRAALAERGLAFEEWHLDEGLLDLGTAPPAGVFYNRMSASSHSRGHRFAPEYTAQVLAWLEAHDRRVVNGARALALEISKAAQYAALHKAGVRTPPTIAAVGRSAVIRAAERLGAPLILKHNRAGKGLGVRLFGDAGLVRDHVEGPDFEPPVDGITLVQRYVEAPRPLITRCEFVGGRFLYAVRVDTSQGFELCPAEACRIEDAGGPAEVPPMFEVTEDVPADLIRRFEAFLTAEAIEIAGIEFIRDSAGEPWTYDVNTNTNYNPEAESAAGVSGMGAIADFLGRELARQRTGRAA